MKKRFFRLNLWIAFIGLLFVGLFYACYDEDSDSASSKEEIATMAEARTLYSKTVGNAVQVYTRSKIPGMLIKPEWKWTSIEKNADYVALEIGKLSEHGFFYVDPAAAEKTKLTGKSEYSQSKTSFIYLKNRKTEESSMFLMTISPTLEYIERTDFKPFKKMSYLKRDKDFSGLVFYHNLQGEFVNGWKYKDGVIVSEIAFTDMDEADFILTRSGTNCPSGIIIYQVEQCYYTYSPYLGEVTHTDCKSWHEITMVYSDCSVINVGSSGGGFDGGAGGTGGAGSGGITPTLKSIIGSNSNLNESQISKLDAIVQAIDLDCGNGFRAIYNKLREDNVTFDNVEMRKPGSEGESAGYDPKTGTLYFTSDEAILYVGFTHELFHLFQRNNGVQTITDQNRGLLEFERVLFNDIVYYVNILKGGEFYQPGVKPKVGSWLFNDA